MTPEERRRQLRAILDQHNEAARALREASRAFRVSTTRLVDAHTPIQDAADHADQTATYVRAVTDAILAANTAALALVNEQ